MKTALTFGTALLVIGVSAVGYDHFSDPASAEQILTHALPSILGWLLIIGGLLLVAFVALSQGKRCLHEYQLNAHAPGLAARRDSHSGRSAAAQLHRRHLFDCHRTDWDIRGR